MILCLLLICGTTASGQSKFHVDVDYHYNLGINENFVGTSLSRDEYKMGGHSIHLTSRYDIAPRWSAGVGVGLSRYTEPEYNTLPVFATVRYKFIRSIPAVYAFADLGYALKGDNFTEGYKGVLGVGYTLMFFKHFGLNFQIAYNLKQFANIPISVYNMETGDISLKEENSTRHSLSLGIGLTF